MSVLTLLLILTAASKMLLYISAYGFTVKRIFDQRVYAVDGYCICTECWQQRRELPFVQYAVLSGAILFCSSLRGACLATSEVQLCPDRFS